MPAFPPLDDDQAERLIRILRVMAYLVMLVAVLGLVILFTKEFYPRQSTIVSVHRFVLALVLAVCLVGLNLIRRGRLRIGGAFQICALWLLLTLLHDALGLPLHVAAAAHVALAICIGPLLGWLGALTLGVSSLNYILLQDSNYIFSYGLMPLLPVSPALALVIEIALYGVVLGLTVLIVFIAQRRSEISQVTAEALEVASYSEKKLETIIESMADVLLVVDVRGDIVKANRAAFTLLGFTESELSGKPLRTLLLDIADDSSGIETMSNRKAIRHASRRLMGKDGRVLPVSLSSAVMTDHLGQPAGIILVAQDMSELEAVRMQLHQSNVRFNQAITFSRIGVFEYDMERGEFNIDENLRQSLKSSGLSTVGTYDDFITFVVPEDREIVREALLEYRTGDKSHIDVEFRITTDRGERWIMVRGALQVGGGPLLIGTFMDVTRRKRAEMELARRDDVLRAVTSSSEAFLRSSNWEQQIPTLMSELGAAAQVSRVYIFKVHRDFDERGLWSQLYEWVAPGIVAEIDNPTLQNVDFEAQGFGEWAAKLGMRLPAHGIVSEMDDNARRLLYEGQGILSLANMPVFVQDEWWGLIGFDDCWTERVWSEPELDALQLAADSLGAAIYRQRVERNLQENRDFLMTVMHNLGQGVTVADGSARYLFVNPAYAAMTGIAPERLIGHRPDEFIDPEFLDTVRQNRILRMEGKSTSYASRIVHVDGTTTDVLVTGVPRYVDGKVDGSYSVVTDVSDRRQVEENRVQLTLEREQMRIMSDFVRDASHDFRTPLSIIQTSLYLLRRKAESPEQLERLQTVGVQAGRLSRLIDGLLTMLELDRTEVTLIPINLKTVAQNAVDRSRETAHKAGLSLDLTAPDEPIFVNGEEGYLMKSVANLIDNAVAFTAAGGRIRVNIHSDEQQVDLSVSDTGVGIAEDEHQRIFERLYKVDKARTIDSGGLGMGLSITKRIMELHGGTVAVVSTPGEGSTFTLTFARAKQLPLRSRNLPATASPITEDVKM